MIYIIYILFIHADEKKFTSQRYSKKHWPRKYTYYIIGVISYLIYYMYIYFL